MKVALSPRTHAASLSTTTRRAAPRLHMVDPASLHVLFPRASLGLGLTWGAFLIGTAICVFLNVFALIFAYKYFTLYPTDAPFLRWMVIVILPIDFFQTFVNVYTCYWHLVTNHANPDSLVLENWSFVAFGPACVVTIVLCQLFYAHRVFRLGGLYRWCAFLAVLGMVTSFGIGNALTIESVLLPNFLGLQPLNWMVASIYGAIMSTDVILSCSLVFMLWRRRSGHKETDTVIASIIAYTISSGVLFTCLGVLLFVFALVEHGNLIFCAIQAFGVQVYFLSMLTALILRRAFAGRMRRDDELPTAAFNLKDDQDGRGRHRHEDQPEGPKLSTLAFVPAIGADSMGSTSGGMVSSTTGQGSSQDAFESTDQTAISV